MPDRSGTHDALTIVSPMICGGETKGQDRAHWSRRMQTACVSDGVSASPRCDEAADFLVRHCAALFWGDRDILHRLRLMADQLIALRLEGQDMRFEALPNVSRRMQEKVIALA